MDTVFVCMSMNGKQMEVRYGLSCVCRRCGVSESLGWKKKKPVLFVTVSSLPGCQWFLPSCCSPGLWDLLVHLSGTSTPIALLTGSCVCTCMSPSFFIFLAPLDNYAPPGAPWLSVSFHLIASVSSAQQRIYLTLLNWPSTYP